MASSSAASSDSASSNLGEEGVAHFTSEMMRRIFTGNGSLDEIKDGIRAKATAQINELEAAVESLEKSVEMARNISDKLELKRYKQKNTAVGVRGGKGGW